MSSWSRTAGEFFVSRVVRLYPAYWAGVLVTTLVLRLLPTVRDGESFSNALVNLTMLQEPFHINDVDAVYWSLWSELRFYLLFAIVVWRGLTYRRAVTFCVVWTIASAIDSSVHNDLLDTWAQPLYSSYFIAGIALYLMYRFGPNLILWGIIGFSWLISQHSITTINHSHVQELQLNLPNWGAQLLVTVYFVLMIGIALGWFSWIRWRWLTTVGALTYPLYLVHEYIGWTMIHALRHRMPSYLNLLLTTLTMVALAWLIHRLVEKPLAKRLKRADEGSSSCAPTRSRSRAPRPSGSACQPIRPGKRCRPPGRPRSRWKQPERSPRSSDHEPQPA